MTTTREKAAEALALAAPAAVEAEMLPGDAERMVDAVLRAIREPSEVACRSASELYSDDARRAWNAMLDSILNGEG